MSNNNNNKIEPTKEELLRSILAITNTSDTSFNEDNLSNNNSQGARKKTNTKKSKKANQSKLNPISAEDLNITEHEIPSIIQSILKTEKKTRSKIS